MPADAKRVTLFTQPLDDLGTGTTSGSYTVAADKCAMAIVWYADSTAGSCVITLPGGAARTITIPANSGWFGRSYDRGQLPAGTTIVITGVLANFVEYGRAA